MTYYFDNELLKKWFSQHKRDLPWREHPTPYAVWVSEVMLQQTQVQVVIPYFERWMQRYPTISHLAASSVDEVIKMWEGLGYYSRARNLHAGAKYVVEHHGGHLPNTYEALSKIKGLGHYTTGAILSFAYQQRVPAVDGNVLRVIARYYALPDDIGKGIGQRKIREIVHQILPEKEPWITSEALIELGATVCQKKAKCLECPLKKSCQAFAKGLQDQLPLKTGNQRSEFLYRGVALLICQGKVLIRRAQKGEIMSDLHEFPYFETNVKGISSATLKKQVKKQFGIEAQPVQTLSDVRHSFTKYQVTLFPTIFQCNSHTIVEGFQWTCLQDLDGLAFSSGHRRVLTAFLQDLQDRLWRKDKAR